MPMLGLIGIAAAVVLPAPATTPASGERPLEPWPAAPEPEPALAASDGGQRLRAVLDLARRDDARALPRLIATLHDRDPGVSLAAARLLARRKAPEATAAAAAWLRDPAPHL